MKRIGILIVLLAAVLQVNAQKKPIKNPTLEMSYYLQGEGGANGLTVVYNPDNNYYYCVQAGNEDFPLEVFDATGQNIYSTTTKRDIRGFWYNPKLKCFEGTMYMGGTFKLYLDANGYPINPVMQGNSMNFLPPVDQSQVVCNVAKGEMYAYDNHFIYIYSQKNYKLKKKLVVTNCPVSWDYLNPYAMFYTGYKNYEFGLYDIVNRKVLFFNVKGVYTDAIQMPFDVPSIEWFRIGFTNDRLFLYDGDYRAWYGYRIFGTANS